MSDTKRKVTELKTAMILTAPFFSCIFLDMMKFKVGKFPEIMGQNPTAATDGVNIWYDEDWFNSQTLPQRLFVLCHEVGHAMWMHMARAKTYQDVGFRGEKFDPGRWNRAGDYVINHMLTECGIGTMPEGGLYDHRYPSTMLVDDVYHALKTDPNDGGGSGAGEGGSMDHHIPHIGTVSEAEMKRVVVSAAENAKAMGKLPASLKRFVDDVLENKVSWVERLRKSLNRAAGRDATTWTRPNRRRLITQGVVLPAHTGFTAGDIVFVVDTSGSMGEREMMQALGECDNILQDCKPKSVTLIGCDAKVNSVKELYSGDRLAGNPPKLGGGGGTSFVPPFEWVAKQGLCPAALVYFTDMYGNFPDDPGYPVIWCSSSEGQVAPFGETIYVEID